MPCFSAPARQCGMNAPGISLPLPSSREGEEPADVLPLCARPAQTTTLMSMAAMIAIDRVALFRSRDVVIAICLILAPSEFRRTSDGESRIRRTGMLRVRLIMRCSTSDVFSNHRSDW